MAACHTTKIRDHMRSRRAAHLLISTPHRLRMQIWPFFVRVCVSSCRWIFSLLESFVIVLPFRYCFVFVVPVVAFSPYFHTQCVFVYCVRFSNFFLSLSPCSIHNLRCFLCFETTRRKIHAVRCLIWRLKMLAVCLSEVNSPCSR